MIVILLKCNLLLLIGNNKATLLPITLTYASLQAFLHA
ncbi:hypothetical protein PTRA_b0475 [Pseudoalteromonas translucida KMM 520]|uniref:Uncharacterized protein n=1 Tax=Pseudoalteromonas translucida KMM 520 TaxID=1315283 RepID=A0A0U2WIR3_9GAMM|nr:hypothetical protein PTRA_b0475 [Pseudoalteromonas translucida KMM 520]